jgi:cytochrome oxidase Cu insertion factor (SCO1/SenC/PrrC family)
MNPGLDAANPALVAAFRSAMLRQLGVIAVIFIALLLAYGMAQRWWAARGKPAPLRRPTPLTEPAARRFLRIAFGLLWIFDGVLQAQPKMAGGLTSQVIEPAASSSPHWVQDVVNAGGTVWSYHPVQAGAAAVWIQVGLGLWLIAAGAGQWSRLAGLATVAWGLIVWVFGEAFGGIFAPGLTWLSGAPGAVLLYVMAGVLITLPARAWAGPRTGRLLLAGIGLFWIGMAALQAWPGRGYWQGKDGTLTGMVRSMAQMSQPHAQSAMVSAFASFDSAHGFAVNLFSVVALAVLGAAFVIGPRRWIGLGLRPRRWIGLGLRPRRRLLRVAVLAAAVLCAADWALVQDFGVPGGLGTDPNSMLPWMLLLWSGYLATTRAFDEAAVAAPVGSLFSRTEVSAAVRGALASAGTRSVAALGAVGVIFAGAAPMAAASADRNADPIIAQALTGGSLSLDRSAPGFQLTSQSGRPVTLTSLRGKVVVLTFLDPVCPDCAVIASEMRAADSLLGAAAEGPGQSNAAQVEFVAIAASTMHSGAVYIRAFDRQANLTEVPNWLFLTGTVAQLQRVWDRYEEVVPHLMAGMMARSVVTFVIDAYGRIRHAVKNGSGPGTASTRSSFAVLLANTTRQTAR